MSLDVRSGRELPEIRVEVATPTIEIDATNAGPPGGPGPTGPPGPPGRGLEAIKGELPAYMDLPLEDNEIGDAWIVGADLWIWR